MRHQSIEFVKERSLEILRRYQNPGGAFVACPTFPTYNYSWFRDGVYIAYALLVQDGVEEARRFIQWGAGVVMGQEEKILRVLQRLDRGETPGPFEFPGARYTLEGEEDPSDWPNFQIDGFGSWLWLAAVFAETRQEEVPEDWVRAAEILFGYLEKVWEISNNDCWEEFGDRIHPATLACVAGGLSRMGSLLGHDGACGTADRIIRKIRESRHSRGYYPKSLGSDLVDASLIWLGIPYGVVPLDDPAFRATMKKVEDDLLVEGGVKRYLEDTYYGGGRWILLSAFLGWYYCRSGRKEEATTLLEWIAAQSCEDGSLPEQVSELVNDPSMVEPWVERWGSVATPLLWSHAMFLILHQEIEAVASKE